MEGRSGQNGRQSHLERPAAVGDSLARVWEDERGPRAAGLLTSEAYCDLWLVVGDPPERIPAARLLLAVASELLAHRLQVHALPHHAEVRVPKMSASAARALVAYSCGISQPFQGCSSADTQAVAAALQEGRLEFTILGDDATFSHAAPMTFAKRLQAALALLFQLCVLLGALAAYYPTTSFNMEVGGAFMDDVMIRRNLAVVEESLDLQRLWRTDYWGLEMFDPQTWTHKSFRPFTVLTFRWNYLAHGFNSHGFYTTNAALHAVTTLQLAHAGCQIFHLPAAWSVVLAALFAVHPVHTESICYVVGRADILCMQATLLSMAIYAPCVKDAGMGALEACVRLAIACGLLLVAGLCKETGFTFFGFFVGWEVLRLTRGRPRWRGKKATSCLGPLLRILVLLLVGGSACTARVWYTSGTQIARMDPYSNPVAAEPDPWVRFLSYSLVHGMYFRLLAWPTFLCYDYSMDAVPLVSSLADVRLLLPCAGYLGLAQALAIALGHLRAPLPRSRRRRQAEAPILGIAIFALSFLPMMNVLFPIGTLVAERLLYIPSAGFLSASVSMLFLLTAAAGQGRGAGHRRRQCRALVVWLLLFATLAGCWALCYGRVLDWRSVDQITLVDGLKQLTSSRTQFNLANLYLQQQNYDDALAAYRRAIAADPLERDSQPLYHAGQILMMKGNYTEAEQYLQKAVSGYFSPLTMHEEEVWHDYGLALWHVGRGAEAIQNFHNSIITNPAFPKGYNNLACASVLVGLSNQPPLMDLVQQGLQAVEQAVALLPGMALYWRNAAVLFGLSGNSPTALQAWERYRQLDPVAAASAEASGSLPKDCVWEFYFR